MNILWIVVCSRCLCRTVSLTSDVMCSSLTKYDSYCGFPCSFISPFHTSLLCAEPLSTSLDTSQSKRTPCLFLIHHLCRFLPNWKTVCPPYPLLSHLQHPVHNFCLLKLLNRSWMSFCPRVSQWQHHWHLGLDHSSFGGAEREGPPVYRGGVVNLWHSMVLASVMWA